MKNKNLLIVLAVVAGLGVIVLAYNLMSGGSVNEPGVGDGQVAQDPGVSAPPPGAGPPLGDPTMGGGRDGFGAPPPVTDPNRDPFAPTAGGKTTMVAARPRSRMDPFARIPAEKDRYKINIAMLLGEPRAHIPELRPPAPPPIPPYDPQPYRRLAGILSGDTIAGILIEPDGSAVIVRPGTRIGEWRVAQMTSTFAVLKRDGNRLPKEVTVRLETPPSDVAGAGAGMTNPGGGGRDFGGGPPGNRRGGPGRGGRGGFGGDGGIEE